MKLRAHLAAMLIGALLALPFATQEAAAHGLGDAWVQVPGGTIRPGEEFEVWGADFGPFATVDLFFSTGERMGQVAAGADGHFTTTIRAPDDLQTGFAELNATSEAGMWSSVWVEVGGSASVTQSATWWTDPSVIVLGVLVIGAFLGVGLLLIRRKPPVRSPAPVPVRANRRRKSKPGRSRRGSLPERL